MSEMWSEKTVFSGTGAFIRRFSSAEGRTVLTPVEMIDGLTESLIRQRKQMGYRSTSGLVVDYQTDGTGYLYIVGHISDMKYPIRNDPF